MSDTREGDGGIEMTGATVCPACCICSEPWFITILGKRLCEWHATQIMAEVRDKTMQREALASAKLASEEDCKKLADALDNGDDAA